MPDGVVTARIGGQASAFGEEAPAEFEYFLADHLPAGVSGDGTVEGASTPQNEEPIV